MRYRNTILIAVVLSATGPISGAPPEILRMHLLRDVRATGKEMRLGCLGIIRGDDAVIVDKASKIAMGRTPRSGEKIIVDRRTILSRLAASGIDAKDVRLTGAKKVTVTRDEIIFDSRRLIELAEAFVKKVRPVSDRLQWRIVRAPKDMPAPESDDIQLKPRLGKSPSTGYVCVEIAAISGGRETALSRVLFKHFYNTRQLLAAADIPSGGVVTPENTKIKVISVPHRPPEWKSPYGMICSQAVRTGTVIRPGLLKSQKPVVVVRRNQMMQMKIQMTGFSIVATGQALCDGRTGELIKVRNTDSKRIIMARVSTDGTVAPVYNKKR